MVCTLLNVRISTSFSALQAPHRMNKESSRASCKQAVDGSAVASQLLVGHAIGDAARDHTHTHRARVAPMQSATQRSATSASPGAVRPPICAMEIAAAGARSARAAGPREDAPPCDALAAPTRRSNPLLSECRMDAQQDGHGALRDDAPPGAHERRGIAAANAGDAAPIPDSCSPRFQHGGALQDGHQLAQRDGQQEGRAQLDMSMAGDGQQHAAAADGHPRRQPRLSLRLGRRPRVHTAVVQLVGQQEGPPGGHVAAHALADGGGGHDGGRMQPAAARLERRRTPPAVVLRERIHPTGPELQQRSARRTAPRRRPRPRRHLWW